MVTPTLGTAALCCIQRTGSIGFELAEDRLWRQGCGDYYVDMIAADMGGVQHPLPVVAMLPDGGENDTALMAIQEVGESLHPESLAPAPFGMSIKERQSVGVVVAVNGPIWMAVKS